MAHGAAPGSAEGRRATAAKRLLAAVAALAAAACGQAGQAAPEPFQVALPSGNALSRAQVQELLGALSDPAKNEVPGPPLPASVFALNDDRPQSDHPNWKALLSELAEAREAALRNGWNVLVEGFTDSSGTAARNAVLSQQRAERTREAALALGYPADRVLARGQGVGGTSGLDRRVVVTFVREQGSAP